MRHFEHLEDLIFTHPDGRDIAVGILTELGRGLENPNLNLSFPLSLKWDGAPALAFGPDPRDGRFFVATKAAFNVTPKLAKTHDDIEVMYKSNVKHVLHLALDLLPALNAPCPLQGDVLFTTEKKSYPNYVAFQPNTLEYRVSDASTRAQIEGAQMGIAIHTMFDSAFTPCRASVGVMANLDVSEPVFVIDAAVRAVLPTFDEMELMDFVLAHARVRSEPAPTPLFFESLNRYMLARFVNKQVREGVSHNPRQTAHEYLTYAGLNATPQFDVQALYDNYDGYVSLFALHQAIARTKDIIVAKLARLSPFPTYVDGNPTGPEGFVVYYRSTIVKLVNRYEFSRLNFTLPKTWQ
jgi:hypothetical protein